MTGCCLGLVSYCVCFLYWRVYLRRKPPPNRHSPVYEPPLRTRTNGAQRLIQPAGPGSQHQSLLLTTLPAELRLHVWRLVIGREYQDDVLHIDLSDGIVKYRRCYEEKPCHKLGFRHRCWRWPWTKERHLFCYQRALLPLLLTCKMMCAYSSTVNILNADSEYRRYHEAADSLYSSNVFDMRRTEAIVRLPQVMLPDRFHAICCIRFSTAFYYPWDPHSTQPYGSLLIGEQYKPPDDAWKWPQACSVLSSLQHLDELHIEVAVWRFDPDDKRSIGTEAQLYLLRPLIAVRASRFTVILTEPVHDELRQELGPVPFQLLQRTRPGRGYHLNYDSD